MLSTTEATFSLKRCDAFRLLAYALRPPPRPPSTGIASGCIPCRKSTAFCARRCREDALRDPTRLLGDSAHLADASSRVHLDDLRPQATGTTSRVRPRKRLGTRRRGRGIPVATEHRVW